MTLSSPMLRTRRSSSSDHSYYLTKPRRARGSMDSTITCTSGDSSMSSSVLRVSKEVENIGERVAISKKRITWSFVLAGSEQVHTVILEHSRISAKKLLKLDGRRLFSSEQYATNWHYDFDVGADPGTPFRVLIQDVTTSVVDQGKLETLYDLVADGVKWDHLGERFLPVALRHQSGSVWSSDMYVRRVADTCGELLSDGDERPPGTLLTWTFAFGVNSSIHKLELRDLEKGEFVVVLDCRELKRVNYDDINGDMWEFEYDLEDQHELDLVVTLVDEHKTYELFIDGCAWNDISETDFVLESGWYPVYSRSRSAVYFRDEVTGKTQWEKPVVNREDPRVKPKSEQMSPSSLGFDGFARGMHAVSIKESITEEPDSEHEHVRQLAGMKQPLQPVQEVPEVPEVSEVPEVQENNLIDFSDKAVPVQNVKNGTYEGQNQLNSAFSEHQGQQPVDLLSL
ncbi:hypothetical protein PsorP6_017005 [Peronosclerospora sorghi]|uniref:Uncharacterized protein n=1 Tax=Peronosclerospora sorghi TaxID=230839 RepID=A0ACC0WFW1_9STRA|nr:hypothetical protein PsorP6_017005 [Peronosclerospora sorghi]